MVASRLQDIADILGGLGTVYAGVAPQIASSTSRPPRRSELRADRVRRAAADEEAGGRRLRGGRDAGTDARRAPRRSGRSRRHGRRSLERRRSRRRRASAAAHLGRAAGCGSAAGRRGGAGRRRRHRAGTGRGRGDALARAAETGRGCSAAQRRREPGPRRPAAARRASRAVRRPGAAATPGATAALPTESGTPHGDGAGRRRGARGKRGAATTGAGDGAGASWHVAVIAGLKTSVESDGRLALGRPSKVKEPCWIDPGRAACSSWADSPSTRSLARQQRVRRAPRPPSSSSTRPPTQAGTRPACPTSPPTRPRATSGRPCGPTGSALPDPAARASTSRPVDPAAGSRASRSRTRSPTGAPRMPQMAEAARAAARRHQVDEFHGCTGPRGLERTRPSALTLESDLRGRVCEGLARRTMPPTTSTSCSRGTRSARRTTRRPTSRLETCSPRSARAGDGDCLRVRPAARRRQARELRRHSRRRHDPATSRPPGTRRGCSRARPDRCATMGRRDRARRGSTAASAPAGEDRHRPRCASSAPGRRMRRPSRGRPRLLVSILTWILDV